MVKLANGKVSSQEGLKIALKRFREHTKKPEIFLSVQTPRADKIRELVKRIYDHGQKLNDGVSGSGGDRMSYLDELVVEEMDEEQIWQQLELKNEQLLTEDLSATSKLLSMGSKRMQLNFSATGDDSGNDSEPDSGNEQSEVEEDQVDEERDLEEMSPEGKKTKNKTGSSKKAKKSIVDDQFFKLDDMARFLDEEDEREMRRQSGKPDRNPLIEIDYFSENIDEGDSDDDNDGDMKYSDFFEDDDNSEDEDSSMENQESEEEAMEEEEEEKQQSNAEQEDSEDEVERNRRLRYELYNTSEDFLVGEKTKKFVKQPEPEPEENEPEPEAEPQIDSGPKSSFELRQERMQQKIQKMEDRLLEDKPWQLKGEISAETRPKNSLLEEVLEFESTTRPAPAITEETTMRLEDIIKQRIKNKAYDDVERKVRPPDNPREFRKQLVLDGEKSKQSLAQIYEKDYLQQLGKANPDEDQPEEEEPKEHKEIRASMKALLAQLDALSNFHYTPRPAIPELKIITNTPAISMEEVAPVATSDAALLAPEEVHNRPKGDVMSKEERSRADKNRERRLKKRFQREKFERQADKERKQLESGVAPKSKELQQKLLKKVSKARNVSTMAEGSTAVPKSSTAFFSQLQDEVSTQIKSKLAPGGKKKKNGATGVQATHVKL